MSLSYSIRKGLLIKGGQQEYVIFNKKSGLIVKRGFTRVEDARNEIVRIYNAQREGRISADY